MVQRQQAQSLRLAASWQAFVLQSIMFAIIYVETSVISYLTSRTSRDSLTAGRQAATQDWWDSLDKSKLRISDLVIKEIAKGDAQAAAKRLASVADLEVLSLHEQAEALANKLMDAGLVPKTEPEDAAHIALATLHGCTYLATWNFSHFVGPEPKYKLFSALQAWGYAPPLFGTPEELLESQK
jgi:predicted nucleic acid-binding protein